jgi:hypothetical protein
MDACHNYFARLYERVKTSQPAADAVKGEFEGIYRPGDVLRIHGGFTSAYEDTGEGEVYTVAEFDGERLTLDRPLHTRAPWLLIVYCEPPEEFLDLCDEVKEWEAANGKSRGLASESIDGYSWSAAATADGRTGMEAAFADRMQRFRRPHPTRLYYAKDALHWSVTA